MARSLARAGEVAGLRAALLDWYDRGRRDLPWRRTRDPYRVLVSEVMLQQTQVDRVLPKYHEWILKFPSLPALARANERDVVKLNAGQAVTVRLKAFEQTFTGQVGAILPVSSGTQNSVALYMVLVDLDSTGAKLLPGMTGQAEINLQ